MQLTPPYLGAALILVASFSSASGQVGEKARSTAETNQSITQTRDAGAGKNDALKPEVQQDNASIWIHLAGGRRTQVDEVTEVADGVWYKRGNVTTFIDRARVERIERSADANLAALSDTFEGSRKWSISDSVRVESFFISRFNRPLPLTAFGQSELHNRWGLDHRRSMDVGLHPESLEGKALIKFLLSEGIPFLAFRGSVPGVATGPHIHIGHGSPRLPARK